MKAQEQGVARLSATREQLFSRAESIIGESQEMARFLMEKGLIPPVPESWA